MRGAGSDGRPGVPPGRVWARIGYLVVLGFALLSPLSFRLDGGFLAERVARLLSPGALTPGDVVDAVRNVVLLAGWGLLLVVTDPGGSRRRRVTVALASGAVVGITAEILQLGLPTRVPSLLDAAMNTAGAGLGALATDTAQRLLRRWERRPTVLGVPAAALAVPYAGAVLVEAAFPLLRSERPVTTSGGPVARALQVAHRFHWESVAVLPWTDFLLFLPAGALVAGALWEADETRGRAFEWAAACGAAIALLGEAAHAPLGLPVQVGSALVHAAAFALGAWVAARRLPGWLRSRRGAARIGRFLSAYAVVLALWRLRPFVPEMDPGAIAAQFSPAHWSPLSALGARRDLYSVSDVLRSFLLFVPVGAALAARTRTSPDTGGPRTALGAGGWILGFAFLLEAGQAFVAGRFFDGTDLLVMAAGGAVALAVAGHPRDPRPGA